MSGNGTLETPWDLATAIHSPNGMNAGDFLNLLTGIYSGNFNATISGGDSPITIQTYNGPVKIDGSIYVSGASLVVRDLEIYDADFTDRESESTASDPPDIPAYDGIRPQVSNVKFINCVIHDTRQGILSVNFPNVEIYGCVIYNVGWNAANRGHGHGIYFSSDGTNPGVTIKNCIVGNTFGVGLHGYGTPPSTIFYMDIEGNTIFNGGILSGFPDTNMLVGGNSGCYTRYSKINNNKTYYPGIAGVNKIGNGATGPYDTEIKNNVFVGGQYSLQTPNNGSGLTVTGNKFHGPLNSEIITTETFPDNEYTSGVPDVVSLQVNAYNANRANLTIYNGAGADTVTVAVPWTGTVKARNVQDYFTDIQTLTISGGSITVNMQAANRTVATPQGWTAPATTFPQFGCFVLERV